MKKRSFIILAIILVIFVMIQLIPVEKPEYTADNPDDLIINNDIPDDIGMILKNACYDCHSNETKYPWYSHIYPVKLLVYKDIKEGRKEMNFSEWESLKKIERASVLDEMATEVSEGDMPMKIYTRMHSEAKLTDEQKEKFVSWTEEFANKLFE